MIEKFTKKDFEDYLNTSHTPYASLGLIDDEECYSIVLDNQVSVTVRSSVKSSGLSADVASDSIRAWLTVGDKPLGGKTRTYRQSGWQERLNEKILQLVKWRMLAGDCPDCDKPKGVFKAKTDKNKGRPFAKCSGCDNGFAWLDSGIDVNKIYFAEKSDISGIPGVLLDEEGCERLIADILGDTANDITLKPLGEENNNDADKSTGAEKDTEQMAHPQGSNGEELFSRKSNNAMRIENPTPTRQAESPDNRKRLQALPKGPNSAQQSAIEAGSNIDLRVLAGPGSGKTFVIEHRYKYLVDNSVQPANILVCTFGKPAATEMGHRILKACQRANLEQICTINALCYRLLTKWYPDSRWFGWKGPKEWQIKKTLEDAIGLVWQEKKKPNSQEVYNTINSSKYRGLTVDDSYEYFVDMLGSQYGEWLYEIRSKFDAWLNRSRFLTFADQLYLVEKRLQSDEAWRGMLQDRFSHVIVDEGQDTNFQAMRILITLSLESGDNSVYESEAAK